MLISAVSSVFICDRTVPARIRLVQARDVTPPPCVSPSERNVPHCHPEINMATAEAEAGDGDGATPVVVQLCSSTATLAELLAATTEQGKFQLLPPAPPAPPY